MTPAARLLQFLGRCTCPIDEGTARLAASLTPAEYHDARTILDNTRLAFCYRGEISILSAGASILQVAMRDEWGNPIPFGEPLPRLPGLIRALENVHDRREQRRLIAEQKRERKAQQAAAAARSEAQHLAALGLPRRAGQNAARSKGAA